MIEHKYGDFAEMQVAEAKEYIRKRVFFLLLVAEDLEKREQFPDVDLFKAHRSVMWLVSGFNDLMLRPSCLVVALSRLEEAGSTINKEPFNFKKYRKLILDAGAEISKIAEPTVEEVTADA